MITRSVDDYLARVSEPQRHALEKLRRAIRAAAPTAEECISYNIPSYRVASKLLVSFGAGKNYCAFYPGACPINTHKNELKGYDLAKGTIRFLPSKPLPVSLVKKLVKTRLGFPINTSDERTKAKATTSKQALQRTASKPAIHFKCICHPPRSAASHTAFVLS